MSNADRLLESSANLERLCAAAHRFSQDIGRLVRARRFDAARETLARWADKVQAAGLVAGDVEGRLLLAGDLNAAVLPIVVRP